MKRHLSLLAMLLLMPVLLLAQEMAPPDFKKIGIDAAAAITPFVAMVLVWGLKVLWSKIPASMIFVVAPVAGLLGNFALNWLAGNTANFHWAVGIVAGWLAVTLREFLTTLGTKKLTGTTTETKLSF